MKIKKKNRAPLAHSNLTQHENLRSHYDPNGSWTGTPDGWDKDDAYPPRNEERRETEANRDVYGDFMPTENGYVQQDGHEHSDNKKRDAEAGADFVPAPIEDDIAPEGGGSYEENTRDMQGHDYPRNTNGNGMADVESGDDVYKNDIEFDPSKYEDGDWKKRPEEVPAPKRDMEIGTDMYPLGAVGTPSYIGGYPTVPDGELSMEQAGIKEDVTPVQDADDL